MRNFQTLDASRENTAEDSLELFQAKDEATHVRLTLHREGIYVTISASYGPMEIALRPRYEDLARTLNRLTVIEGLHTSRQVGTGQAYLALGLTNNDHLLLSLTIVADATGHINLNVELTSEVRKTLYDWLQVTLVR